MQKTAPGMFLFPNGTDSYKVRFFKIKLLEILETKAFPHYNRKSVQRYAITGKGG